MPPYGNSMDDYDYGTPPSQSPPLQFRQMPDVQTPEGYYGYQQWLGNQVPQMSSYEFNSLGDTPMGTPHPGFQTVQSNIAQKEGIPMKNAGAILAKASRNASAAAKNKNPNLKKVK